MFTLRDAQALGIRRGRADARDLHRPYPGVRATSRPEGFADTVASGAVRLKPGQLFVGVTAARLWGLPYPRPWRVGEPLHVCVPTDATPPTARGIQGRRLAADRVDEWRIGTIPVVDPVSAAFSSAPELTTMTAVVMLDALLSSADNYPGLRRGRPIFTTDLIAEHLRRWGPFPGVATIRAALQLAQPGVESPKETETRLLLLAAGLPEPVIQHEVRDGSRLVARVDLAYPQWRIAIEYEGDGHRTDAPQWRRDIQRQRALEERGWIVIRLTHLDLVSGGSELLASVRRAMVSRGN